MIIFEKDRHVRKQQPFFDAHKAYNEWFLNQFFNNEHTTFISTGDLYHTAIPSPEEVDLTEKFFNDSKFEKIYILAGNHDFSTSEKEYSILPLRNNPRIEIIVEPCVRYIDGNKVVFLPFMKNVKYMKEAYENLSDEYKNADYCVYHFDDESVSKKGINLSYLNIYRRIGGHNHLPRKNYELCVPIIGKYDERGQKPTLLFVDAQGSHNIINVPIFIDYYDFPYGESPYEREAKFPIFNIIDAPSKKCAEKLYENLNIHEIKIVNKKKREIKKEGGSNCKSTVEFFNEYIIERSDIQDWALQRLKSIIMKK
jgi:hypothetical protein